VFHGEVAVNVGHKGSVKVDDNSVLIVGNPQGICDEQFRLQPINLLNKIIIILVRVENLKVV
jgi:hypothetical protein